MAKTSGKQAVLSRNKPASASGSKFAHSKDADANNKISHWFFNMFREEILEDKQLAKKLRIKK
ncbi:hypothetical protein [Geothrix mesophila]|uniref:hypothetical protein n=1 Tax=Geothrix mesophila TaxID=2922723 RepID=UPI001FAE5DE3|nr:hypothetical protein [Geothrix sp. SG198]